MADDVMMCVFAHCGFDRVAQGVAGAGRSLASDLAVGLHAVVVGPAAEDALTALAAVADRVTAVDHPRLAAYEPELYLAALEQVTKGERPRAVLLGSDTASLELSARLAHRLGGSPMSDGTAITSVEGRVRVTRSAYGGKAEAVFELERAPAVVWLRGRAFAPAAPTGAEAVVGRLDAVLPEEVPTRIVDRHVEEVEGVPLEEAEVVIGGGRGLGGPEPFRDLRELAELLSAAVGASRAACDEGWVPPSWQIGQTGKKIAPELYLAVAISGAAQHLLGVSDAKRMAAVNNDPDAPIFRHCDFAIVEDYRKVLPPLIARLRELL